MDQRISVYVDDAPSRQQIAAEIAPLVLCHVASKAEVYRLCDDWGIPRAAAAASEDFALLPDEAEVGSAAY
jgi:hypothetical protein